VLGSVLFAMFVIGVVATTTREGSAPALAFGFLFFPGLCSVELVGCGLEAT